MLTALANDFEMDSATLPFSIDQLGVRQIFEAQSSLKSKIKISKMLTSPSFVLLLLSTLFSFNVITCNTTVEERQPICFDDNSDDPPFPEDPNEPDSYHKYLQLQRPIFVPFKILFLIDDQISTKEIELLEMSTQYVNDRLSKIIQARVLADVRIVRRRTKSNCSVCGGNKTSFPEEYLTRCYPSSQGIVAGEGASEKVTEQNGQNYTLVVRVLVNGDGITLGGTVETGCRGQLPSASECSYETKGGPTHGRMIFCMKPSEFENIEQLQGATLHEIMHVIIPSFTFHHANPEYYNCSTPQSCEGKTWKALMRNLMHEDGRNETMKAFLAIADPLPTIAKKHFHCEEAEGVELHSTTVKGMVELSNHWSARLFADELLAPADSPSSRLSVLTLGAIAAYKNWYRVDMSYAEELSISRPSAEMGCDILRKSYGEIIREQRAKSGVQRFRPYCDNSRGTERAITSHCSDHSKRRYTCAAKGSYSSLTANRGAYDTDVCASVISMNFTRSYQPYHTGAWYGPGTICVTLTDVPGPLHEQTNAVCVLYECKTDTRVLVLKFFSNNWTRSDEECFIECSPNMANQIVTAERKPFCTNMNAGNTAIICPDYEAVCEAKLETSTSTTSTRHEKSPSEKPAVTKDTPAGQTASKSSNAPTRDHVTSAPVTSAGVRSGGGFHGAAGLACVVLAAYI